MYRNSRQSPKGASPASSPQTNPLRTNNSRETSASPGRDGSEEPVSLYDQNRKQGPSPESVKKLDQIIQNLYLKTAVVILQARIPTTVSGGRRADSRKANKWFQLETDDIEEFRDEFKTWKASSSFADHRPPPLVLETYLDISRVPSGQSVVLVDESGARWDVSAALNSSDSSVGSSPRKDKHKTEIILERWRIELKHNFKHDFEDFGLSLPTIYKRCIVFFRSLFTSVRMLPSYRLSKSSSSQAAASVLNLKCRVFASDQNTGGSDALRTTLTDDPSEVTSDYLYGDLDIPVGLFSVSTCYRNECNLRLESSESLLSSRLINDDESYFRPSLPGRAHLDRRRESTTEVGSLPTQRQIRPSIAFQQTYGSLSTFHGEGALATSPLTALRGVRTVGSDGSPSADTRPDSVGLDPPHSLPAARAVARPSLHGPQGSGRRPSVSFQPFKAGSLSGSPRIGELLEPPSPQQSQRQSGISALAQARGRNSLTAGMAASLRGGPPVVAVPLANPETTPGSSSPRPTSSRFSSSFSHRKGRLSFGGTSRTGDDDQGGGSSGKGSLSSSIAQPGSGLLAEASHHGSSGSLNPEEDNISELLKALDSKKTLQSFSPGRKGEQSLQRTTAQISKFQSMRETNNALTESMISSTHLHRSSTSSSRQLQSVPGMVPPTSVSISSSPGKPLSPHTPHTPAVPSRLSENSIVDNRMQAQSVLRTSGRSAAGVATLMSPDGTTAIDIPLSPRVVRPSARRSSSVAQQQRILADEDDDAAFAPGHRSSSLGAAPEPGSAISTLFPMEAGHSTEEEDSRALQPSPRLVSSTAIPSCSSSASRDPHHVLSSNLNPTVQGRLRYHSNRGRATPPGSSRGSFAGSSSGRYAGGSRGEGEADEEPLMFDISEIGRQSHEETLGSGDGAGRGGDEQHGGHAGTSSTDRSFEPRGVSRRGWQ